MRPIKFRGRWLGTGELVYGSYCHMFYCDVGTIHTITDEGGEEFTVDPDSVAQLVGYDKDGREVYEGDKVTSEVYEGEFVARLTSDPPYPILQEVAKMTVKETEP